MVEYITEKSGRKRKAKYVICDGCGNKFLKSVEAIKKTKKHYCNPDCLKSEIIIKKCANCGKDIRGTKNRFRKNKSGLYFCCRKCKDISARLDGIKEIHPDKYGIPTINTYRKIALLSYPNKCSSCGYDTYINVLEVHHIDGDRSNNNINNLIILCPTCHKEVERGFIYINEKREIIKKPL